MRPDLPEKRPDVLVVGAGMAGACAAFAAARLGLAVTVIDNRPDFPDLFRCEKLTAEQQKLLADIGLADAFRIAGTPSSEVLVGRGGRIIERRKIDERGISYREMIETVRRAWPANVTYVTGSVTDVLPSASSPAVLLNDGRRLEGRLVVLASGNDQQLHTKLGVARINEQPAYSTAIGFNLLFKRPDEAPFRALTYWGERAGDGIAFAAFFPIGEATRVNFFCYRGAADPALKGFSRDPLGRLSTMLPGLAPLLAGARAVGKPDIRQITLHEAARCQRDGVVLIGDAYRVCCPVTGMGVTRLLTDVRQLMRLHVPHWLESNDVSASRIGEFYADNEKRKADRDAETRGSFLKRFSTETTLPWRLRRTLPKVVGRMRGLRNRVTLAPAPARSEANVGASGR